MDAMEINCDKDIYTYYGNFDWIMYAKKHTHINFDNAKQIYKYFIEEESKKNNLIYFDINNTLIEKYNLYTYNDLNVSKENFQWLVFCLSFGLIPHVCNINLTFIKNSRFIEDICNC